MYFKSINFVVTILAVSGSFQAVVSAFQVLTQPNVTAVRGRSVTLPCTFPDGHPGGVYWYAHNYTDSSIKHARIVAQEVKGVVSTPGGPRYSITKEYSLVITNVAIQDETTFTCVVVVPEADGMNRTNVRVIALANPLHPVVNGCPIRSSGTCANGAPCCVYTVADIVPFSLICSVNLVRPAVNLTWTGGNGEERHTTNPQTLITGPYVNDLFSVSTKLEVSKPENGQNFICKASGEGVNGTAHVTASVQYPPVKVSTELSLTSVWGGTIRLPCRFEDHPTGVYWFRHSATGAPFVNSDENLLVHFFRSQANAEGDILVQGGPRFKMTSDYSLMISNVAVGDETTYSCQVAGAYSDGRNETDLRVIEKSGLSAGGVAGIIILFLLLLIGTVIALLWFYGKVSFPIIGKRILNKDDPKAVKFSPKERKRSLSKDDPEAVPLSPQERKGRLNGVTWKQSSNRLKKLVEVNALIEEIKDYRPGDFSPRKVREDRRLPEKIQLELFGMTDADKILLAKSFNYAVSGDFFKSNVYFVYSTSLYPITEYISVVYSCAFRDLDGILIPKVMAKILRGGLLIP